jgi:hypothetical protein
MRQIKRKAKSTAGVINAKYTLVPNVSLGPFKLRAPIDDYFSLSDYVYYKQDEDYLRDFYEFKRYVGLSIYVNKSNLINHIDANRYCLYQNMNMIGCNFNKFKKMIHQEPDTESIEPIVVNNKNQKQHVYDFDNLGLQIWVRYNIIKAVICGNYSELVAEE